MTRHADYFAPAGLRTRGTIVVVPGRGETPAVYARFGSRLAYDAYRVRVVDLADIDQGGEVGSFRCELARRLTAAVAGVADEEEPGGLVRPLVLAGSDLGAAGIAALVARPDPAATWWPEAVVLAGLPGYGTHRAADWRDELDARTRCPVHRGVLDGDASFRRGMLADGAPDQLLDAVYGSKSEIPHLLLVGDDDPVADHGALARAAKGLRRARLVVVRGGHHDVLNDLQHRSVAAEVVTFLETVRGELVPAIVVETSGW
jgi:alpha-beta hydrolase superfamily lysophospholipase